MELDIADFDAVISRYNKRRAADVSVAARESKRGPLGTGLTALDAALVQRHTGVVVEPADDLGGMADFVAGAAKRGDRGKPS